MAMTPEFGLFDIPNSGKKHELGVRETRIRIQPPSFVNCQTLSKLLQATILWVIKRG